MKKILIIVGDSQYFLFHRLSLSVYLQNHGSEIFVVTDVLSDEHRNKIESRAFKLYEVPSRPASVGLGYSIRLINYLVKLYKTIKPDVILSVSIRMSFLSMIAMFVLPRTKARHYSLITGLGFLATSEAIVYKTIRVFVMGLIKVVSLSEKFHIIVQNQDDYLELSNLINKKRLFLVLGSGIDHKKYFPRIRENNSQIIVTMVSRMLKDKGVAELVSASKILKERGHNNFVVQLVGETHNFNPNSFTRLQLQEWHDKGYVNWLGQQTDIVSIYQKTDIAVLPSYREGLPKSLLEAASCGLPIITTDTPGCREICIHGYNGLLVKIKDSHALAEAILKLAQDYTLRHKMGRASRVLVEDKFSADIINAEMMTLITNDWGTGKVSPVSNIIS